MSTLEPLDPVASSDGKPRAGRTALSRAIAWVNFLTLVLFSPAILVILGWFTEGYRDSHGAQDVSHRLHEVVFGILFACAAVGAASQIRRPSDNTAGFAQLTASILLLSTLIWMTIGWEVGLLAYLLPAVTLAATRRHRGTWAPGRIWWGAALWAMPMALALFGRLVTHVERALAGAQDHTTHWTAVAAFQATMLAMVPIVVLRLRGYRVTLITLAAASLLYGAASLAFPFDASGHRPAYSVALLIWGATWMVIAVRDARPPAPARPGSRSVVRATLIPIGAAFVAMFLALAVPALDTPPNVPHGPNPDARAGIGDVSRDTCIECHSTGLRGAPVQSADHLSQICEGDCTPSRVTCLGCHQIDPVFKDLVSLQAMSWEQGALSPSPWAAERQLTDDMLVRASTLADEDG